MIEVNLESLLTGVAFVAGVLAILAAVFGSSAKLSRRIDKLDLKIDGVELKLMRRIDSVEQKLTEKIDGVEAKLTHRIDSVEQKLTEKIDGVEAKLTEKIEGVEHRLSARDDTFDQKATARSDALERKLDRYYAEFVEFRLETKESFGRVEAQLARHDERLGLWERYVWARSGFGPEPQPSLALVGTDRSDPQSAMPDGS
ncbi:MAG: apolipoprotein A1/A4/E family protein [Actinobacteria bacterium]|nr:apolipoprotein A1/A4/E family protein [Actinomycetota bacterium]